ncbi:MAG: VPLPA-CTERM sorting domain-containing protein [Rhodobacteraceae bacterium]|jgi:hypothetical protein|nr:VPLPA-CTERM sorting domain-containing protein [Paracoccaceae bacterium]
MSLLRHCSLALVLATGLAASASAATFNIAFTQTGLGDGGPDWFGSFDTGPGTALLDGVTRFDVTIGGVRFDDIALGLGFFNGTTTGGTQALSGLVADTVVFNTALGIPDFAQMPNILFLTGLGDAGTVVQQWGFGVNCSAEICTGPVLGTYTITQAGDPEPPVIPLPASAALLPIGLGALALIRRRRAHAG